jgi:hypothetical protein
MRLSEAIALGRTMIVSNPGATFDGYGGGCAIGMGMAAVGKLNAEYGDALYESGWKWSKQFQVPEVLPCGCESHPQWKSSSMNPLGCVIAHLFDRHVYGKFDMTLDRLIDWVRSVEPNEDASESAEQLLEEIRQQAVAP